MTTGDRAWLEASGAEESAAFAKVYDKHVRSVYRYALHVLRSAHEAEDITQEVFILAWAKRRSIRLADRSLLPWLLVTSRNLSLNRVKQLQRDAKGTTHLSEADAGQGPHRAADDDAEGRMLLAAIDDAVDDLSMTDQTLYHLCITEGLSYQQAATTLGTTHGAVRNRLARLRRSLQIALTPQREGLS
jgi:RNA polymerase sigma factor (sigma-70 family)